MSHGHVPSIQNLRVIKGPVHHLQIWEAKKIKNRLDKKPSDGAETALLMRVRQEHRGQNALHVRLGEKILVT